MTARSRTLCILAIAMTALSGTLHAASEPVVNTDWVWLRQASVETLEAADVLHDSPRYGLIMALNYIEVDVTKAAGLLDRAAARTQPGTDEARLAAILKCSFAELLGTTLSADLCDERGVAIELIEHPLPATIAQVHFGIWLATNGQYTRAFQANRLAEKLALRAGYSELAATAQNNQGVDYLIRGLPVQAMNKFELAIQHLRESGSTEQESFLILLTSNIASAHIELGEFESANELLQSAINSELYDRNNPVNLIDETILARAALALGRPQQGYDRLSAVLENVGPLGSSGMHAYAHSVIGDLQIALGNTEAGLASFLRAREHGQRSGDPLQVNKVDVQFAEALLGLDRFEEASKTIESSIAALTEREPSMILARALDLR
ncbi:MAG: hypothetical protein AB8B93_02330, partial [Pseudomonadales bacterium]